MLCKWIASIDFLIWSSVGFLLSGLNLGKQFLGLFRSGCCTIGTDMASWSSNDMFWLLSIWHGFSSSSDSSGELLVWFSNDILSYLFSWGVLGGESGGDDFCPDPPNSGVNSRLFPNDEKLEFAMKSESNYPIKISCKDWNGLFK